MPLRGPVATHGDAISIHGVYEDDHPDRQEYLPETDEVRYAAFISSGEPVKYHTAPYERLAAAKAASIAADHVGELVVERLGGSVCGLGVAVEFVEGSHRICVMPTTYLNRRGDVVREPTVTLDEVVAVTPRSVTTTVEWLGREHTETVGVVAKEETIQEF